MRVSVVRCLVLCTALATATARADVQPAEEEPKVAWALVAGSATALVPFAAGGAIFAGTDDSAKRRDAVVGMLSGLALAPIVSHLVVKEWARAGIFGAIPVACVVGIAVLLELRPSSTLFGQPGDRLSFGLLISLAALSSGIGLADTLGAARRVEHRPKRAHLPVLPLPFVTTRGGGLVAGGTF